MPEYEALARVIAEGRRFVERRGSGRPDTKLVSDLVAALESRSAPAATDDEREELEVVIQGEDERWDGSNSSEDFSTRVATAVLAAGFRRPSPVTREALAKHLARVAGDWTHSYCGSDEHDLEHTNWKAYRSEADAILSRFSLPEPAKVNTSMPGDDCGPWVPVKGTEQ